MKRLAAIASILVLAACGAVTEPFGLRDPFGVPQPFRGKERNAELAAQILTAPAVMVGGIEGLSPEDEAVLRNSVAKAAQTQDVVAVLSDAPQGSWSLNGTMRETPLKTGQTNAKAGPLTIRDIEWLLKDETGRERERFSIAMSNDAAERTADRLRKALTLEGETAGNDAAKPDVVVKAVAPHAFVAPVTGAPGDGNAALARAMTVMLADAGVVIGGKDDPLAWRILGRVKVSAEGAQDRVALDWEVLDQSGASMGVANQSNAVPSGSLKKSWGETAALAAAAGASGIVEIIAKAHNGGLDPRGKKAASSSPSSSPAVAGKP